MEERIEQELALLRKHFEVVDYAVPGNWMRVRNYVLPQGWSRTLADVAFPVPSGYPGAPPYGIYVHAGLTFNGIRPLNYQEPSSVQPPFDGTWGVFSWTPFDGHWYPTADIHAGPNLLNFVRSFAERFREGV